jgi:hypothetical protein
MNAKFPDTCDSSFIKALQEVTGQCGYNLLSDDQLLLLIAGEICRTYTRQEKNYGIPEK